MSQKPTARVLPPSPPPTLAAKRRYQVGAAAQRALSDAPECWAEKGLRCDDNGRVHAAAKVALGVPPAITPEVSPDGEQDGRGAFFLVALVA